MQLAHGVIIDGAVIVVVILHKQLLKINEAIAMQVQDSELLL